jgi:hypothetical protein
MQSSNDVLSLRGGLLVCVEYSGLRCVYRRQAPCDNQAANAQLLVPEVCVDADSSEVNAKVFVHRIFHVSSIKHPQETGKAATVTRKQAKSLWRQVSCTAANY